MSNPKRDASGRLTFEFFDVPANSYPNLCAKVIEQFGIVRNGELAIGPDAMFQDYSQNEFVIGLEWDIWSGFMVVAKNSQSEPLARQIAEYLQGEA